MRKSAIFERGATFGHFQKHHKFAATYISGNRYFQKAATFEGRYLRGAATFGGPTFWGPLLSRATTFRRSPLSGATTFGDCYFCYVQGAGTFWGLLLSRGATFGGKLITFGGTLLSGDHYFWDSTAIDEKLQYILFTGPPLHDKLITVFIYILKVLLWWKIRLSYFHFI